ncbi:iron-containing redox enzyme family protein [Cellulomonas chengniuliangii]|uniref:Iron-containing redox enzyme family protein n=1 Tax=Cellulomonas chengniuliangii TaxID=2968084 RepID=A0ABY5L1D2_9CELL|nr:iron-containing redox enzyme family protein [Cellulomonas chengniuliangii]MCC2308202.1 iron-containing redox enzyme family protein [Cellulomonas chengniuliangii]UUI76592.1 iron-containing redox enzyme family protein [Cellulomonas chengniuliangii]
MRIPPPRGPVSETLIEALSCPPGAAAAPLPEDLVRDAVDASPDLLRDEDLQLALYCLYELHYRGFDHVDDRWEWEPRLIRSRALIEAELEAVLRGRATPPQGVEPTAAAVAAALFELTAPGKPGLASHIAKHADEGQLAELLMHRSVYQLKEADPHTWAIPRLAGHPKAALVEIQADEYGGGNPARMHSALFARTMRGLGLDDSYGRYVDRAPAITLASVNAMSLFGLHRRLRGAIAGHLAAFEMTSSLPNRLYGNGFRRLGHDEGTTDYFDEHVEADAVHEQIAGRDLAGRLAQDEPALLPDILFGAAACLLLDDLVAEHMLDAWGRGETSLRPGAPAFAAAARVGA